MDNQQLCIDAYKARKASWAALSEENRKVESEHVNRAVVALGLDVPANASGDHQLGDLVFWRKFEYHNYSLHVNKICPDCGAITLRREVKDIADVGDALVNRPAHTCPSPAPAKTIEQIFEECLHSMVESHFEDRGL